MTSHKSELGAWCLGEDKRIAKGENDSLLVAVFEGGNPKYFSPEQSWLAAELAAETDATARREFRERYELRPATSDLYQCALVVLELHMRAAPWVGGSVSPVETVQLCIDRTPAREIETMSATDVEHWLTQTLQQKLLVEILSKASADGKQLLSLIVLKLPELMLQLPGMSVEDARMAQYSLRKAVSHSPDQMPAPFESDGEAFGVSVLLSATFSELRARPVDAKAALRKLKGRKKGSASFDGPSSAPAIEHEDDDVSSALIGMAKLAASHDTTGALAACAEWIGIANSEAARDRAVNAYCQLVKQKGEQVEELNFSRDERGHWKEDMLNGVLDRMMRALWARGAPPLEIIDLSEQRKLPGAVLKMLLGGQSQLLNRKLNVEAGPISKDPNPGASSYNREHRTSSYNREHRTSSYNRELRSSGADQRTTPASSSADLRATSGGIRTVSSHQLVSAEPASDVVENNDGSHLAQEAIAERSSCDSAGNSPAAELGRISMISGDESLSMSKSPRRAAAVLDVEQAEQRISSVACMPDGGNDSQRRYNQRAQRATTDQIEVRVPRPSITARSTVDDIKAVADRRSRNTMRLSTNGDGSLSSAREVREFSNWSGLAPIRTLKSLSLRNCANATGTLPMVLGGCDALTTLDLSGCQHYGSYFRSVQLSYLHASS